MLQTPVVATAPPRSEGTSQGLSRPFKPPFLALQPVQNLPLPALLDALDPDR